MRDEPLGLSAAARTRRFFGRGFLYLYLAAFSVFFLYPIFYSLGVTFMNNNQFRLFPPGIVPAPHPWYFANLRYILLIDKLGSNPIGRWYINSLIRVGVYVFVHVFSSLICGFVFSRMRFRGRNLLFILFLVTTMLPGIVTFTPTYLMMVKFPLIGGNSILGDGGKGFLDTYSALLILGLLNINGIFLVRMAMDSAPKAVEEASIMDGARLGTIIFRVVMPSLKAILAYVAITTLINVWNDWYTPFVFANTRYLQTLPSGLMSMTASSVAARAGVNWPLIIALGLAMTIPCLIIYIVFQRYIVEGLTSSAVKG